MLAGALLLELLVDCTFSAWMNSTTSLRVIRKKGAIAVEELKMRATVTAAGCAETISSTIASRLRSASFFENTMTMNTEHTRPRSRKKPTVASTRRARMLSDGARAAALNPSAWFLRKIRVSSPTYSTRPNILMSRDYLGPSTFDPAKTRLLSKTGISLGSDLSLMCPKSSSECTPGCR